MDILLRGIWFGSRDRGTVHCRCMEQRNFFNSVLLRCLEPGERVEADNGYVGHADKINLN